ncbi:MAG: hypothetical protein GC151_13290 [Betaproteobacteria bacterium]|nr:hypothetical protein [Betaproteobacteria bacterium]
MANETELRHGRCIKPVGEGYKQMTVDKEVLENLKFRVDCKLKYAEIHLEILRERGGNGGSLFDRAIEESILFHLFGARDEFLLEINAFYDCELNSDSVTLGALRRVFQARGTACPELTKIHQLENEPESWLANAKVMRNHATHIAGVPRAFHIGGEHDGKVYFRNPRTGEHVEMHVPDALAAWIENMRTLLEELRSSAKAATTV